MCYFFFFFFFFFFNDTATTEIYTLSLHDRSSDLVVPLVHGDLVAGAGELLRGGETGRAGADHGHLLAGRLGRGAGRHPAFVEGTVDDLGLDLLDRHRTGAALRDRQHARRLARCGAEPPRELGEVVGGVQLFDRGSPGTRTDQVVPLRDPVSQRAAVVTERNAAVHAAPRLAVDLRLVQVLVD